MKKPSRNGHAFHPIMKKGGVHDKTNKTKRHNERQDFKRKFKDWLSTGQDETADDSAVFHCKAGILSAS